MPTDRVRQECPPCLPNMTKPRPLVCFSSQTFPPLLVSRTRPVMSVDCHVAFFRFSPPLSLSPFFLLFFVCEAFAPPVHFLSTYNRNQMKDVFLGKGAWAVLCSGEGAAYDAVFKRFGTASKAMKGMTKFGVVDCTGSLPSGKSILQKFELSVRDTFFFPTRDVFGCHKSLCLFVC